MAEKNPHPQNDNLSTDWPSVETRRVLDSMAEFFLALDRGFNVVFANRVLESAVSEHQRPLSGQNLWTLWPEMKGTIVEESFRRAFGLGLPVRYEFHRESSDTWISASAYPYENQLHVFFTDITGQKRAEAERQKRESFLRSMVDSLPQIAWASGPDMRPEYMNRRWFEYSGLSPNEPSDPSAPVHPHDLPRLLRQTKESLQSGKGFEGEGRLLRHDGQYRWHLIRVEPRRDEKGATVGWFGTSTDIHDLKTAEDRLIATTNAVPAFIAHIDARLVYRFCNQAFETWLGRPPSEVVGMAMSDLIDESTFQKLLPHLKKALAGEKATYEQWLDFPQGRRFMRGTYVPSFGADGKVEGIYALIADETDAQFAKEALKASEERFRKVIDVGVVPMGFCGPGGALTDANDALLELLGYTREELLAGEIRWEELIPPEWPHRIEDARTEYRATGRIAPQEREHFRKDRTRFWGIFGGAQMKDDEVLIYALDISDRKRAEAAAQEQLTIARTIADNADSPLMLLDRDGKVTFANPAFFRVTGYTPEDLTGKTAHEIIHYRYPDGRPFPIEECPIDNSYRDLHPLRNLEETFVRKDGTLFPVLVHVAPLRDEAGLSQGGVLEFRDVTEERARGRSASFLAELAEVTRTIRDPKEIMAVCTRMLGSLLGTDRCTYCEVEGDQETIVNVGEWSPEVPSIAGHQLKLSSFGTYVSMLLKSGQTLVSDDVCTESPSEVAAAFQAIQIQSVITCPLIKGRKLVAFLSLHGTHPRTWSQHEVNLVELVIERCWSEMQRARAEKGLRESENRLRQVLEAATVGVIVNDVNGKFTYCNPPLLSMLGYGREDLASGHLSWSLIQAPDRIESDNLALAQLQKSGSCDPYETELAARDGRRVPVFVGAAFIPDESGEGIMGAAFVTDLTSLKSAQRELEAVNRDLDERVRTRTAELVAANQALETYSHHVAHDLRAPLRAIASTSRMIQEDFGESLNDEMRGHLGRQIQAASRLSQLIDDLLKSSRLSREEMTKAEIDFSAVAREAGVEALTMHPLSQAVIAVQDGLATKADPRLFRLALVNLVENAVKYSPAGGKIHVGKRENGPFYVADEGIGIDEDYFEKIFEPFQRLHRNDEYQGTGIGLSNVRQVLERHGGKVWVESQIGKGSTFLFTLD